MAVHIVDFCEEKARKGDGQFAIAFAILQLAQSHEQLVRKVAQLGFDGPGGDLGAFEFIGTQLRDLREALSPLIVSASVDARVDEA